MTEPLPTCPAVIRAVPANLSLEEWRRFEFAADMGAWEWAPDDLEASWQLVAPAAEARRLGPAVSADTTSRQLKAWCVPSKASEVLATLRGLGVHEEARYRLAVEGGRPCGEVRLVSGTGSALASTVGKKTLPTGRSEPTPAQHRAISRARAERREELEPLRLEVSRAISAAGWRRARPVVEEVLGHPVNGPRGAWWSEVGKRNGARIIERLSVEPPALVLDFGQMEDAASADIPEPSGVPAVETVFTTKQERNSA